MKKEVKCVVDLKDGEYPSDEALKLDNQICFPLYAASRKIISLYTPFFKPLGITYTQYLVFMALWEKDEQSVGELCKRINLDSGTLTPLLKNMEKDNYVIRFRDKSDERVVMIKLTKNGKEMKNKVKNIPFQVGEKVHLSQEEAATLYKLLYKVLGDKYE